MNTPKNTITQDNLVAVLMLAAHDVPVLPLPKKKAKGEGSTLSSSAKAALGILDQVTMGGRKSITKKEWRATCVASDKVSAAEKLSSRRDQFRRAIESLAQAGLYTIHGDDLEEVRLVVPLAMLDPAKPEGATLI